MKKIFLMLALVASVGFLASCSDDDYTSKYKNPAQTSEATCSKLMTGVFYAGKQYTFNTYWRMYTWDNGIIGKYSQTIGFTNTDGTMYYANDGYIADRWNNFYNILAQFRALQNVYNNESVEDQKNDKIFLDLSEVFLYDHLSQIIDIWGDVPFEKAGYLGITSDVASSYASYDDAKTLYTNMLTRLGELSTEIASASKPATLAEQDFICKGDLSKWVKYTNALRLRLAVRVATQGELASVGQAAVKDVISKSLPTTFDDNISLVGDDGSTNEFNFSDAIRDGYKDHSRASQAMLNVLTKDGCNFGDFVEAGNGVADDPRLPIMYSKNAAGQYKGLSTREDYGDQTTNTSFAEAKRVYSRIDSTTVIYNQYMRHPVISTAEVDFLRAEAYQRGWASGDAKAAFIAGVVNSTKYYYDCNSASESTYGYKAETTPTDAEVKAFAEQLWNNASDKIQVIITQKWLNFGFLQPSQAWNEVRRTGYPALYFQTDSNAQLFKTVPSRMRYPNVERNNNAANYNTQIQKMGGSDDAYTKIFWAK